VGVDPGQKRWAEGERLVKLYVVYTGEKPPSLPEELLIPIESPPQNYSELWVHKKIWKEQPADAVGIFHCRRYLDFSRPILEPPFPEKRPLPYRICRSPKEIVWTKEKTETLLQKFDVIAPIAERTGLTVRERFGRYPNHRLQDLDLACRILLKQRPDFAHAAEHYLSGDREYYGNLFFMRWSFFDRYCQILFPVLEEFEAQAKSPPPRAPGYLGERIFGIYFTWLQSQPQVRCGEVPRVHFWEYDDKNHHFHRAMLINQFLPPGSNRRCWMKLHFDHLRR